MNNNRNIKNLKPIQRGQLAPEELKNRQRNGGIKSGETRRKNKKLKEELLYLLDVKDKDSKTMREKICFALISQALIGNIRAFEAIRSTIGENPTEKIEQNITGKIDSEIVNKVMNKLKEL